MARRSMLLGSTCIFRGKLGLMLSSLSSTGPLAPGWSLGLACMWPIALAASPGHLLDFKMMTLLGCGALLLSGAGCTINGLLDPDIDTMVARTKLRPIASGVLPPFQGALLSWISIAFGYLDSPPTE